jgi:pimeloyl-ACP methyl ester carboxylesterase
LKEVPKSGIGPFRIQLTHDIRTSYTSAVGKETHGQSADPGRWTGGTSVPANHAHGPAIDLQKIGMDGMNIGHILAMIFLGGLVVPGSCEPGVSKVRVDDMEMAYRIHGDGPPLILIMGFSGTMDLWDPTVLDALSSRFKVIVFDNRGMGGTTAGEKNFSIEQFADDAAGLMDALKIPHAFILGWSMGTEVALELALRHPRKVDRLVLYAADCSMKSFPPSAHVLEKLYDTSGTGEEQGKRMIGLMFPHAWLKTHGEYIRKIFSRPMGTSSPGNIKRQADAMESWNGCCERLHQIDVETLLITGTEDILTPPQNSYWIVDKMPRASLATFDGGGHGVMYQYPQEFSDTVIRFMEGSRERKGK